MLNNKNLRELDQGGDTAEINTVHKYVFTKLNVKIKEIVKKETRKKLF